MFNIVDETIIDNAINCYGHLNQDFKAVEELAECARAISRVHTASCSQTKSEAMDNLCEEIADVYIMLAQLVKIHNIEIPVKDQVYKKVDRLDEYIKVLESN